MILAKCDTVIPPPDILEKNVRAVINFIQMTDTNKTAFNQTLGPNEKDRILKRIFKNDQDDVDRRVRLQMAHIKKGCLSYPNPSYMEPEDWEKIKDIDMHQMNIKHKTFSKQGTSNTEALNSVNQHSVPTMMGIQRADCNLWFGLDRYNNKKESIRVGTEQMFVADEM
jgi:hypothetical protein